MKLDKNATKYIICTSKAPMYAMGEICQNTQGPTKFPVKVPLWVLEKLLHQKGSNRLDIYEVTIKSYQPRIRTTDPIRMTLENYDTPYEELAEAIKAKAAEKPKVIPDNRESVKRIPGAKPAGKTQQKKRIQPIAVSTEPAVVKDTAEATTVPVSVPPITVVHTEVPTAIIGDGDTTVGVKFG